MFVYCLLFIVIDCTNSQKHCIDFLFGLIVYLQRYVA